VHASSIEISVDYHDTDEDRIGTSPFHCQINQEISEKFDFDCDWVISQPLKTSQQGRFIVYSPPSSDPIAKVISQALAGWRF
jgi:hypothetical protein